MRDINGCNILHWSTNTRRHPSREVVGDKRENEGL